MTTTVVALYDTLAEAQQATQDLVESGFNRDNISLAANDASGQYRRHLGDLQQTSKETGHHEDAVVDVGAGALVGGISGLLVGLGVLLIPGIGPIIAAGPLITALMSTGIGTVTGGLLGALIEMGIPTEQANSYVEGIRRGGVLLTVQTDDEGVDQAKEILDRHHPVNLNERTGQWQQEGWRPSTSDSTSDASQQLPSDKAYRSAFTGVDPDEFNRYEARFRQHYQSSYVNSRYNYDDYAAAYQYGLDLANYNYYYGSRSWREVESEVRVSWEEKNPGTWDQFKAAVAYAWEEGTRSLKLEDDYDTYEDNFRRHYINHYARNGSAYSDYEPAYHYGYNLSHDARFQNRTWAEVEPEARHAWEERYVESWDQFKDAVRHAWEEARRAVGVR